MNQMNRMWIIFINVAFVAMNLVFWFAVGTSISLFFAGFHTALVAYNLIEWMVERKFNRELNQEIQALSRNYDHQMSLFPQNNTTTTTTTTEVTKND